MVCKEFILLGTKDVKNALVGNELVKMTIK